MAEAQTHTLTGARGGITAHVWPHPKPRCVVLLVHGYGEHMGRYPHVADALVRRGAAVFGPDHMGHGLSEGERVVIEDFDDVVTDVHTVGQLAAATYPDVPVVVVGHSMGGLIAARYAQRYRTEITALVLSGPVLGRWAVIEDLLGRDELPDVPIDPRTLSRDPAVGAAYAADPLVWHGPFRRVTVEAFDRAMRTIADAGDVGTLPTLWIHGLADTVVPLDGTRVGVAKLRGGDFTERLVPGARHEVFNEIDRDEVLAEVTGFIDRVLAAG